MSLHRRKERGGEGISIQLAYLVCANRIMSVCACVCVPLIISASLQVIIIMISPVLVILMCVFTHLLFKHSNVCIALNIQLIACLLCTHLRCIYPCYVCKCVFPCVCVYCLLTIGACLISLQVFVYVSFRVCLAENLQTKGGRCDAISHRANSSKISDSFVCVRERTHKKDGRLIGVPAH